MAETGKKKASQEKTGGLGHVTDGIEISASGLQGVLGCPLCFWLDWGELSPPALPLPGILNRMDGVVKRFMEKFIGSSKRPSWFPVRGTFLGPKALEATDPRSGVTLKGRLDALAVGEDGHYYIVDYKTASPKDETPDYRQLQLDAYAWLLEQNGMVPVGGAYLLYFMAADGDLTEGRVPFEITPIKVELNPGRIPKLLRKAKRVIEMESPPKPDPECEMCNWRGRVGRVL